MVEKLPFPFTATTFWQCITFFGLPFLYLFLISLFLVVNRPLALQLLVAIIAVEIICWSIKIVYRKDRPVGQHRTTFIKNIDANSFPSIHVARVSVSAWLLFFFYHNALFFLIGAFLVVGVGYSRIFLKKHYLIDVLAGALIGALVSIIIFFA
jgi:undecaprenyl-diphosphatase